MKLFLINESDFEKRKRNRAANMAPDEGEFLRAMTQARRSRPPSEHQSKSLTQNIEKLKKHPRYENPAEEENPDLTLVQVSISWSGGITREQALATGLYMIDSEYDGIGAWDIIQEGDGCNCGKCKPGGWIILLLEVTGAFLEDLLDNDFVHMQRHVGSGTSEGSVTVQSDWA